MSKFEDMTIAEARKALSEAQATVSELSKLFGAPADPINSVQDEQSEALSLIGKKVIVRCRNAGVHFGELVSVNGQNVTLKNARRMWRWWSGGGEITLSGVARHGLADRSEVRIAGPVDCIILPEACEIISMSAKAATNVDNYRVTQAD